MSEAAQTVPEPPTGGTLLRQAREQAGVHVAALAVALKVPVRQLEALEQDRMDLLPDHTFARALAASVCRHLKADPAPILAALPQGTPRSVTVGPGLNEPFRAPGLAGASGWRDRLLRPSVLAALALLLAALALIFLPGTDSPEESRMPAGTGATPTDATAPAPAPPASHSVVIESVTPLVVPVIPALPASAVPLPAPVSPSPAAAAARQP